MGLCSYYRRFVPSLHELTKKNRPFMWNAQCQRAFEVLKENLITASILALPRDDCQYILNTDASDVAVGAVLSQVQDGEERVIAYYSAKYSDPETNYCTTRKELLVVVKALRQFRPYLLG